MFLIVEKIVDCSCCEFTTSHQWSNNVLKYSPDAPVGRDPHHPGSSHRSVLRCAAWPVYPRDWRAPPWPGCPTRGPSADARRSTRWLCPGRAAWGWCPSSAFSWNASDHCVSRTDRGEEAQEVEVGVGVEEEVVVVVVQLSHKWCVKNLTADGNLLAYLS